MPPAESCIVTDDDIFWSGSLTWLFEPVRLAWHLDAPPPQSQGAVQAEHGVAVSLLIKLSIDELLFELGGIAPLPWCTAVLVPVLSSHSHREVHCGQQAQHRADDQSCGISIVYHGLDSDRSFWARIYEEKLLLYR